MFSENIKTVQDRLNSMKDMLAFEYLRSSSTLHNRLGLIFTCVNSVAGRTEYGGLGNVEMVKDAVIKSDFFSNQRKMIIREYQGFLFLQFVLNFLSVKHPVKQTQQRAKMTLNDNTKRGLTHHLMNDNLAVFVMTYCSPSTHIGRESFCNS
jgi:hypothetical protein